MAHMGGHRRPLDPIQRRAKAGPRPRGRIVLTEPAPGPTPRCPVSGAHERTRRWWRSIHGSAVSSLWDDADRLALDRLAWAVNEWHCGRESRTVLSEIARLERALFLTPLSRQNAGIVIDTEPEPADRSADELAAARETRRQEARRRMGQVPG